MSEQQAANILLLDQAVDFFGTYADRTHHGRKKIYCSEILPQNPYQRTIKGLWTSWSRNMFKPGERSENWLKPRTSI
jgi:hypothetical protein